MSRSAWLRLPVVSAGAEYLVMGYLMRRNILAYKAPERNEGYDLICVHPDPRHRPRDRQRGVLRIQVKSRYASDSPHCFPMDPNKLDAFDFLIAAFLNIGRFNGKRDGTSGRRPPVFYSLPASIVRRHFQSESGWPRVQFGAAQLGGLEAYRDDRGFDLIAQRLGVDPPSRDQPNETVAPARVTPARR